MLEKIKKTLNDIKSAIIERGVEVGDCDSPSTYASKILAINNNGVAMAFIPVFKVSDSKPARPTTTMSALNPTNYPDGWGEPDNLSGNIWMSYTLVGNSYVYIPWTDPILINGEYTAPVSRTFTIFGQLSNLDLNPSVPVGGTWDVANNRLVGDITSTLSNGNTLTWSAENKRISGQYTYVSNGTFSSETEKGSWSVPYCINEVRSGADGVGIRETVAYYRGSINATGETAPDKSVNPEDEGWTTDATEIELSTNIPYLWKFTRIIYTDDSVWQDSPYVVRMYVDTGYQEIIDDTILEITDAISELRNNLNEVKETDALIKTDPENGLIALLTSYKEDVDSGTQTSFADVVANAADATIKQSVGSVLGKNITGVEATLDGINGLLRNQVTKLSGIDGTVADALQQIKADSITQSVSSGQYYWQRRIHDPESEITDPTVDGYWKDDTETRSSLGNYADPLLPCTVVDTNPITYNTPNPETGIVDGLSYKWFREITIAAMSAIKQTTDDILLVVGEGTAHRAAIDIIAADYDTGTSKIILDAANIQLNGNVLATALNANQITVTGENSGIIVQNDATNPSVVTTITPNGFTANNANIKGTLESTNGFFGTRTYNNNTEISRVGVNITSEGLESSNYSKQDAKGFSLTPNNFEFYSDDGSKVTNTGIVATKVISGDENGMMTEITETGFRIKLNDKPMAFFELNNTDPDNPYVVLKIMGKSGWCELAPDGPHTQNNTTTVYREPKWWEVQLGKLYSSQESIIINYDPSGSVMYLPFDYPTLETYYRYEVGTKTVTENGVTTVWYWDPVASEYILTVPTCNGKIYTRKYVGESQQLEDGLYTNNYNYLGNTIVYPPFDSSNNGYHVYEITFEQYTSNAPTGTTYTVQARKRYTPNSSTLYGGEELETSNYDTSTWDQIK